MRAEEDAIIALALTPGIGPRSVARLTATFGGAVAALAASGEQWAERTAVPAAFHRRALGVSGSGRVERVREECEQLGIDVITLGSPSYPEPLAAIHDPPAVLYVRGQLPVSAALTLAVAIVGTRKPSSHGLSFTYRLARSLARSGSIIVSGLATGIDAEAHRAVVDEGGVGVAVLPGGLDAVHPPVNRQLALDLLDRGCLLSEHPPGTSLRRGHFVGRNRIVSGLARAVVVIEAGERSGALITAEFALEQGRTVCAMPGRPGDARVVGSLGLLRDGAVLVESAVDVADEIDLDLLPGDGSTLAAALPELRRATAAATADRTVAAKVDGAVNGVAHETGQAATSDLAEGTHPLFATGRVSFDALLAASGLGAPQLIAQLTHLELAGRIRRGSDGLYYLTGS